MSQPTQKNQSTLFNLAIEIDSSEERSRFLDDACQHDSRLRAELERLIANHFQAGLFLERPPAQAKSLHASSGNLNGQSIGPYVVREQIGEGGMGIVYVAEQSNPVQRRVALKIIKPGMDTKEVIARFEAERQALAFMEHPNIARVLDAGTTNCRQTLRDRSVEENATIGGAISDVGRPYFVMELVRGIPITEYCDQMKATPRERLELFQSVCDAVQHAHQKGIIHRDIKPSNVLVTQIGAKPVVKVIDFGLAKAISGQCLTDKTLYTGFMKLMGTPAYMSPEQAGLSSQDVDTRSDVYSLGVLLYELLTGTTPLDKTEIKNQAYDELCRQIREEDVPKPSTRLSTLAQAERSTVAQLRQLEPHRLRQILSGDLDRVVLKSLEKDRDRRYESPKDLTADIERFLDDKPVLAVSPGSWYLAKKYMRRNKVALLVTVIVIASLGLTTAISTYQAIETANANTIAEEQKAEAENSAREAIAAKNDADAARKTAEASEERLQVTADQRRRLLYIANMQLADSLWHSPSGTPTEIHKLLTDWIPTDGGEDLRELAWQYQWTRLHQASELTAFETMAATLSPRGNLVIADERGIHEWDDATNSYLTRWTDDDDGAGVQQVALSACGRWAAVQYGAEMRLIQTATGEILRQVPGTHAEFAAGGNSVLVWSESSDDNFHHELYNLRTGGSVLFQDLDHHNPSNGTGALSPDGKAFYFGHSSFLRVSFLNQQKPYVWRVYNAIRSTEWSPNGKLMASGHYGGQLRLRFSDAPKHEMIVNTGRINNTALRFSHDSRTLAVGSQKGTIDFYDISHLCDASKQGTNGTTSEVERKSELAINMLDIPRRIATLKAHIDSIHSIAYSQDGTTLATRDNRGVAKLWRLDDRSQFLPRISSDEYPLAGRVGVEFEVLQDGVEVDLVDAEKHEVISGTLHAGDRIVSLSDDSGSLTIDSNTHRDIVWRFLAGLPNSIVTLHVTSSDSDDPSPVTLRRKTHNRRPNHHDVTFTSDGSAVIVAGASGALQRTVSGRVVRWYPELCVNATISPDGRLLALDNSGQIVLWDLQKDELKKRMTLTYPKTNAKGNQYGRICFSPDGKYFAMGTGFPGDVEARPSELKIWETATLKEVSTTIPANEWVFSQVAFTPDSNLLIATDHAGKLRFWNTSSWKLEDTQQGLASSFALDLSTDGKWVAQGGFNGIVLLDAKSRTPIHILRDTTASDLKFSTDGRTLVTTTVDGRVEWVDVELGMQLASMPLESGFLTSCDISPDENSIVALSFAGDVWLQDILSMDQIDHHSLTLKSLFERGKTQVQNAQFAAAEATLSHVLQLQLEVQPNQESTAQTRRALIDLMSEHGRFPTIIRQPKSQRVDLGTSVTLNVDFEMPPGIVDCRFQWFFENAPIQAATNQSLTIRNVTADQLGRYRVEIYKGPPELQLTVRSEIAKLSDAAIPTSYASGLRTEWFFNIGGKNVSDLTSSGNYPHQPDEIGTIENFELPSDFGDGYGVRMQGFIVPPQTGNYIFYVCSDDSSELYLSTDDSKAHKRRIACLTSWKRPGQRQWESLRSESVSEPILLQAGERYYVEALFKEGGINDLFAVTWQLPGEPPPKDGAAPIPGEFLEYLRE